MTAPKTFARNLLAQAAKSVVLFCTDGGANDGKGVEATCTSDGSLNVNLTGGAVGGQTVAQGTKTVTGTNAWLVQVMNAAGTALIGRLAAAASLPVVLSNEDLAQLKKNGTFGDLIPIDYSGGDATVTAGSTGIWVNAAGDLKVDYPTVTGRTFTVVAGLFPLAGVTKVYQSGSSAGVAAGYPVA